MDEILRLMGHVRLACVFVVIVIVIIVIVVMMVMVMVVVRFVVAGLLALEGDGTAAGYNVVCGVVGRRVVVIDNDSSAHDGPLASEEVLVQLVLAEVLRSVVVGCDVDDPAHVCLVLVGCLAPDVAVDPWTELECGIRSCALHAQDAHLLDLEPVSVIHLWVGQGAFHCGRLVLLLCERNGAAKTAPIGFFDLTLGRDL